MDPTGAYGQTPYGPTLTTGYYGGAPGAVAVLTSVLTTMVASGAAQSALRTFGRQLRNLFKISKRSKNGGAPAFTTPAASYASANASEQSFFGQTASSAGRQLRDAAARGVSSVERAWDDPLGTVLGGVSSYYSGVGDMTLGYLQGAYDHFGGMASGLWALGTDPLNTAPILGRAVVDGLIDNVANVVSGEAETYEAVRNLDPVAAAAAQWKVGKNSYEAASTVYGGASGAKNLAKGITKAGQMVRNIAAKGGVRPGQAGRYGDLARAGNVGDNLTPHHMPQAAQGFTSRADGGASVLPHGEHVMTRTYGSKGRVTRGAEQGMPFRDVLARDIRDVRANFGTKYDQGLRDLIQYYRTNFPDLMAR